MLRVLKFELIWFYKRWLGRLDSVRSKSLTGFLIFKEAQALILQQYPFTLVLQSPADHFMCACGLHGWNMSFIIKCCWWFRIHYNCVHMLNILKRGEGDERIFPSLHLINTFIFIFSKHRICKSHWNSEKYFYLLVCIFQCSVSRQLECSHGGYCRY